MFLTHTLWDLDLTFSGMEVLGTQHRCHRFTKAELNPSVQVFSDLLYLKVEKKLPDKKDRLRNIRDRLLRVDWHQESGENWKERMCMWEEAETCRDWAAQWSPEELQQVGKFKQHPAPAASRDITGRESVHKILFSLMHMHTHTKEHRGTMLDGVTLSKRHKPLPWYPQDVPGETPQQC